MRAINDTERQQLFNQSKYWIKTQTWNYRNLHLVGKRVVSGVYDFRSLLMKTDWSIETFVRLQFDSTKHFKFSLGTPGATRDCLDKTSRKNSVELIELYCSIYKVRSGFFLY
jgi:hypothetical protein